MPAEYFNPYQKIKQNKQYITNHTTILHTALGMTFNSIVNTHLVCMSLINKITESVHV